MIILLNGSDCRFERRGRQGRGNGRVRLPDRLPSRTKSGLSEIRSRPFRAFLANLFYGFAA
jgi:hypothetical protein